VSSRASAICFDYPVPVAVAVGYSHTGQFRAFTITRDSARELYFILLSQKRNTLGGFRDRHLPEAAGIA
jgi:hypothetical protein